MPISMSAIWDETAAMIRRESHLLVPIALATVGIGSVISGIAQPETPAAGISTVAIFGFVIGNILVLIGNLAMMALALRPGMSVEESLRLAMARLPKMIGVSAIFLLGLMLMVIPIAIILEMSGTPISANMAPEQLPMSVVFSTLIVVGVMIYVYARLFTVSAAIIDRNPPAIEAIKSSFASTQGITAKIVGVILLFLVVSLVVGGAVASISGILFGMVGKAAGAPLLGKALTLLVTGMVSGLFSIVTSVFAAMLYRKLSAE